MKVDLDSLLGMEKGLQQKESSQFAPSSKSLNLHGFSEPIPHLQVIILN
jgi:hypothetical protein